MKKQVIILFLFLVILFGLVGVISWRDAHVVDSEDEGVLFSGASSFLAGVLIIMIVMVLVLIVVGKEIK